MLHVETDFDIWERGRDAAQAGRLTDKALRANYSYVRFDYKTETQKVEKILRENFERDHMGRLPYLIRFSTVFFQDKEDAHFFHGLLYVY